MRIGHGYDVHRTDAERDMFIGSVKIDCGFGLLGHSDADVLLHAIMDALLGAAALGDIGKHFPDKDPQYKNIDSLLLAKKVAELLYNNDYKIINVDATVIAEAPKIAPYIPEMRKNIANALYIDVSCVSIKATTEEGLGFTGKKEGIAALAVALID